MDKELFLIDLIHYVIGTITGMLIVLGIFFFIVVIFCLILFKFYKKDTLIEKKDGTNIYKTIRKYNNWRL